MVDQDLLLEVVVVVLVVLVLVELVVLVNNFLGLHNL
jgi:hypothetical protein